ncbi:MAG: Nif3-like dinuclear metal center hexameric protein [Armatimonadetes bacterium]|nr:Nif3-like dinuclear metal center hexameric protein [Armatimonadota bacterium]
MTALELNHALRALWPELNPEKTVDRIIAGNPDQVIEAVAVCWMPYSEALRQAVALGANTVVAHEPTFYDHWELRQEPQHARFHEAKEEKQKLIEELGITIMRCHDVWDILPEIGVPHEWGRFLGLGEPSKREKYYHVYSVEPAPAIEWTQRLASKTKSAGQATLQLYGDPQRVVTKIGIGTGCASAGETLFDMGADLAVAVDDISRSWIIGEYCNDTGNPLVVVSHGVSEACAMGSLAEKIRELLPGVTVNVIPQGAGYREITG